MPIAVQVEIVAGVFALLAIILTGLGHRLAAKHRHRVENLEKELQIQSRVLSMARLMGYWEEIKADIDKLMATSEINRFLILVAWNGKDDPQWVTATYQYRGKDANQAEYIHTPVDDHYREMLRDIRRDMWRTYTTESLPDKSLLREIYDFEQVTGATIHHLGSYAHPGGSTEVDFCSYGTNIEGGLTGPTELRCRLISARFRDLASKFEETLNVRATGKY